MKSGFIKYAALLIALYVIATGRGIAQPIEGYLPGVQGILPQPWTCRVEVPTDSNEWPRGLDKPLFCAIFNNTENLITGCFSQESHPGFKLCFYPIAHSTEIEEIIVKESIFSWCIPVKYLVSSQYYIVTSPCYINDGCFSASAQKGIAPLDSALAKYFKPVNISLRDSVVVSPHIFSGRVDPLFIIRDSANVAFLHRKINSINSQITLKGTSVAVSRSWWPGMRVTYHPLPIYSKMYYPLEVGRDSIASIYQNVSQVMAIKSTDFLQYIIDILIKEDPVSIMGRDTIRAAQLFKTFQVFTGISPQKNPVVMLHKQKESTFLGSNGNQIELYLASPGRTTVELFNGKGQVVNIIYKGMLPSGVSKINLPQKTGCGNVGILRLKAAAKTDVFRTVLLR